MSHINSFYTVNTQVTEPLLWHCLLEEDLLKVGLVNSPIVPVEGAMTKKNSLTYAASL